MSLCGAVEGADVVALSAIFADVANTLNVNPKSLGALTMARALLQAISSPFAGFLDARFERRRLITIGCIIWSLATVGLAFSMNFTTLFIIRSFNGIGLGLVPPLLWAYIADSTSGKNHGKAFGILGLTIGLGATLGVLVAVVIAGQPLAGIEGWRVSLLVIALTGLVVGVATLILVSTRGSSRIWNRFRSSDLAMDSVKVGEAGEYERGERDLKLTLDGVTDHIGEHEEIKQVEEPGQGALNGRRHDQARDKEVQGLSPYGDMSPQMQALRRGGGADSPPRTFDVSFRPTDSVGVIQGLSDVPREDKFLRSQMNTSKAASGKQDAEDQGGAYRQVVRSIGKILRIRTFQILLFQGVLGSMPWTALAFLIWWLELACFSRVEAATLSGIMALGSAIGNIVGGLVGDQLAHLSPNHGRIVAAQVSVLSGIPLTYVILFSLPTGRDGRSFGAFSGILFLFGIMISWCSAGVNAPIMSEIVPKQQRSIIFSLDRTIEGAVAAIAPFIVGSLAVDVFGWQGREQAQSCNADDQLALGRALFWTITVTWSGCFLFYSSMHFTYPKDKLKAAHKAEGWAAINAPDMSALWASKSEFKGVDGFDEKNKIGYRFIYPAQFTHFPSTLQPDSHVEAKNVWDTMGSV